MADNDHTIDNGEGDNKEEKPHAISREAIFSSICNEANGFYGLILTVSTGFLFGTLAFMEKIAPHPTECSMSFLVLGCLFLNFTIGIVSFVRFKNLESGKLALEGRFNEAGKVDDLKEVCCKLLVWFLFLGIGSISVFALVNINHKIIEDSTMANNQQPNQNAP